MPAEAPPHPTALAGLTLEPAIVLLFSVRLHGGFSGFGDLPAGVALPEEQKQA